MDCNLEKSKGVLSIAPHPVLGSAPRTDSGLGLGEGLFVAGLLSHT